MKKIALVIAIIAASVGVVIAGNVVPSGTKKEFAGPAYEKFKENFARDLTFYTLLRNGIPSNGLTAAEKKRLEKICDDGESAITNKYKAILHNAFGCPADGYN